MASIQSSVGSTAAVMQFPCGHSEPDVPAGRRIRAAGGRAVWIPAGGATSSPWSWPPPSGPVGVSGKA
jgi:hypothetical protein